MQERGRRRIVVAVVLALCIATLGSVALDPWSTNVPSFRAQACGLPHAWLELIQRGYHEPRSGHISLLPRTPAYMASGGAGWSHSGPWRYLQHVPLVFYGPSVVDEGVEIERAVTFADIATTLATLLRGSVSSGDGSSLPEVARLADVLERPALKLIMTIVWDGGGWNTLRRWPDAWPNLRTMMSRGVSFTNAVVGSSPSVTPAVHTTLGTGVFPDRHGITGVPVRDEDGTVVDSFLEGRSSRFIEVETLAERWDRQTGHGARVAMVGYEPWHLGMIGKGAEAPGGDKDDAVWLDTDTNGWVTNPDHYSLPASILATEGLDDDITAVDLEDGADDGRWHRVPLDDPARKEETPAFIRYHTRAMIDMIRAEGYGTDRVTDLVFTNFKQIDRIGHYYNMASAEVRDNLAATDEALGEIVSFLDGHVGRGRYVVVVTADHGQQPDAPAVNGYGIDPNEIERDIDARFGPITRAVWPTEAFLLADEMERRGVTVADVAHFLGDYRLRDNAQLGAEEAAGAGLFEPTDRLFALAIPASMLPEIVCAGR